MSIAGAPKLYKIYLCWSFGNSFAKMLVPGLHAQIFAGTWFGILEATNQQAYANAIGLRLKDLLQKQAKLQQQRGQPAPMLSPAALDAAVERCKGDAALCKAISSTTGLTMWHKLEKTPLDSPALLEGLAPDSQARWLVETLRGGYLGEIKQSARRGQLDMAAQKASKSLQALSAAVDAAAITARAGYASGANALEAVAKASQEANEAIEAVRTARLEWPGEGMDSESWNAKLKELQETHAHVPAVVAELQRLSDAAGPPGTPPPAKEAEVV